MYKLFSKLYEKSSTGKIKHWIILVQELSSNKKNSEALIRINYGSGDSKVRVTDKIISVGKNIGRSNETTPYEQALLEAESTWKKKKDKGYVENLSDLNKEVLLPMLAHSFQKRGHNIEYPAYVQPKLDGVRCLAKKVDSNTIKYYSRMGKEFTTLEHLTPELLKILKVNQVLDGEIYSHDIKFQELIRLIKKLRPDSNKLEYHVYDLVDTKKTFDERWAILVSMFDKNKFSSIKIVDIETGLGEENIKDLHMEFVQEGYEGVIIRNSKGLYKLKGRSPDLQKYKEFKDDEFIITGGHEGSGAEEGCVIFNVKNNKDQRFAVRPRGSFEQRKQWMKEIDFLIGKRLTVRYQEKTDDGIPRFPVGISIRDYESK